MRYVREIPPRTNNESDVTLYEVVMNKHEAEIIDSLLRKAKLNMPETVDLIPTLGRVRSMIRVFGDILGRNIIKKTW